MISPWYFYLIQCVRAVNILCYVLMAVYGFFSLVFAFGLNSNRYLQSEKEEMGKMMRQYVLIFIVSFLIVLFLPNKQTITSMFVTSRTNNTMSAQEVKEMVDYIIYKTKEK